MNRLSARMERLDGGGVALRQTPIVAEGFTYVVEAIWSGSNTG
jgi:hypothetical protein